MKYLLGEVMNGLNIVIEDQTRK